MGLFYLNGQTLNQIEPQLNSYVQQSLKQYQDSGALQLYEQKGVDRQEIEASFNRIAHTLVQHLPAIYFIQAAILIALTLYFAAQMARRRGIFKLQKRPFSQEVMPWQLAWLVIAGLALWLLGSADSVMRLTGSNLLVALAPIAAYFGLSIVFYGLNRMGPGRKAWSKALVIMLLFLLTKPILAFLALLGLFDSLLDYRKLRTDKEVSL
jgi:uncharacterized protein YybS (DUF2232 family)